MAQPDRLATTGDHIAARMKLERFDLGNAIVCSGAVLVTLLAPLLIDCVV